MTSDYVFAGLLEQIKSSFHMFITGKIGLTEDRIVQRSKILTGMSELSNFQVL